MPRCWCSASADPEHPNSSFASTRVTETPTTYRTASVFRQPQTLAIRVSAHTHRCRRLVLIRFTTLNDTPFALHGDVRADALSLAAEPTLICRNERQVVQLGRRKEHPISRVVMHLPGQHRARQQNLTVQRKTPNPGRALRTSQPDHRVCRGCSPASWVFRVLCGGPAESPHGRRRHR